MQSIVCERNGNNFFFVVDQHCTFLLEFVKFKQKIIYFYVIFDYHSEINKTSFDLDTSIFNFFSNFSFVIKKLDLFERNVSGKKRINENFTRLLLFLKIKFIIYNKHYLDSFFKTKSRLVLFGSFDSLFFMVKTTTAKTIFGSVRLLSDK